MPRRYTYWTHKEIDFIVRLYHEGNPIVKITHIHNRMFPERTENCIGSKIRENTDRRRHRYFTEEENEWLAATTGHSNLETTNLFYRQFGRHVSEETIKKKRQDMRREENGI